MPSLTPQATFLLQHALFATKLNKRIDLHLSYHGLSFTEFMLMHHLACAPDHKLPRIELAEKVGITASGVTRLLAPMEKTGIVQKKANPRDARQSLVQLSSAGQTLYVDALVGFNAGAKQLLDNLNNEQIKTLAQLITLINL